MLMLVACIRVKYIQSNQECPATAYYIISNSKSDLLSLNIKFAVMNFQKRKVLLTFFAVEDACCLASKCLTDDCHLVVPLL